MNLFELIDLFKNKFLFTLEQYSGTDEWIDDQLDIYQYPFDKEMGYQVIHHNNKMYINLLFDNINNWEETIRQETPYKNFKLIPSNLSEDKWYSSIYEKFKAHLKLTQKELDKLYQIPFWSKQMKYYGFDRNIQYLISKRSRTI